jgi:mono/diheme cytochrome c family protein
MTTWVRGILAGAFVAIGLAALTAQNHKPEMRPTDSKESIARGESFYKSHCAICHFAASTEKKIGPGLKGLSKRVKFADGTRNDNQNLVKLSENGGKNMPPSRENISDAQLRDLLAYLRTL